MKPELVVLGNLVVDDIVYENGSCRFGQAGGAALYAALGAALWGTQVALASVIGSDYPVDVFEQVKKTRVDLSCLRTVSGPSMRSWLLYEGRRRQLVHRLDSPSHSAMSPEPGILPTEWRPRAIHLAPMPLPVQTGWLRDLAGKTGTLLSLDTFELIEERSIDRCCKAFAGADLLFLSEDELLLSGALDEPQPTLAQIAQRSGGRLARVILKRGRRGGLLFDREDNATTHWGSRTDRVVDATGAGDAFAGGFLAGMLRNGDLSQALERGIVSASFALEGRGPSALLTATPEIARDRRTAWFPTRKAQTIR